MLGKNVIVVVDLVVILYNEKCCFWSIDINRSIYCYYGWNK